MLVATCPSSVLASPDAWDSGFGLVGADGPIYAATVAEDGTVTVGGDIDVIGGAAVGNLARWDGSAWHPLGDPFNGAVRSIIDHDGTTYVGGDFTKARFANVAHVAKWNGEKWSAIGSGIQGPAQGTRVNALAFFQGNLYVAGNFTKAGGQNAVDIAYWDGSAWHGIGATSTDAELHELVVFGDRLCVAGAFTQIGDLATKGVACWDGVAWGALGVGLNGAALAMAEHNGYLYVGGTFSFAGGRKTGKLARWNGSAWESVDYPLLLSVASIGFRGDKLVVGLSNGSTTDPDHPWLIEWNGALWTPPSVQPDGVVHAIVPAEIGVLAVGAFPRAGEVVLGGVGLFTGTIWTPFVEPGQRGLHGFAENFATWQGQLYVAGRFKAGGEVPAALVARWNAGRWEVVGNTTAANGDSVDALVALDDGLYAGGKFAAIGGTAAANIARWDGAAWSPLGAGTDDRVSALATLDGKIYAGGSFLHAAEAAAAHIAVWDGAEWTALGDGLDGNVLALSAFDGDLIAGGAFLSATAGSVVAHGVARWDGSKWHAFGSGLEGTVRALQLHDDALFAGGALTASGITPISGVARWNDSAWLPLGSGVHESDGVANVHALASSGSDLFVGGSFGFAGDVPASQIARYDGAQWHALSPGFRTPPTVGSERVTALLIHDQNLWVGGSFVKLLDERPAARVISWHGCSTGSEAGCATTTTTTTSTTTTTTSPTTTTLPFESPCGDANDDGDVTASDSQLALRTAVGSAQCERSRCDADDSGEVTATDSLLILRFAVGQPATLDCPLP